MEPLKVKKLPIEYAVDKELLSLLAEANLKYGEYKSNLKNTLNIKLKTQKATTAIISELNVFKFKYIEVYFIYIPSHITS